MKKITDFIKAWWEFILTTLVIAGFLAAFIAVECSWDSTFLRIIGGVFTMIPCGILSVVAFFLFGASKYEWENLKYYDEK